MSDRYTLDEHGEPVPEPDLLAWACWFETADRHIGDDTVNGLRVSTVFLAMDHSFACPRDPNRSPVLWETMVFGPDPTWHNFQDRYETREHALAGHAEVVRRIRAGEPPP